MAATPVDPEIPQYTSGNIQVLKGLEAVRKRPGMYIGSTSSRGLHHLVYEVVDNSIDEAMAGHCTYVDITIHQDNSVTVVDDGRGIPVDMHPIEKKPGVELAMTVLHAGGKFDKSNYKVSGGLHGVGVSVVNALSEWLDVEVHRDGYRWHQRYERGIKVKELEKLGPVEGTGTRVVFKPDAEIFTELVFSFEILTSRFREMAFLNRGLKISIRDEREEEPVEETFQYEGGIASFVEYLRKGRQAIHDNIFYFEAERPEAEIELAMQYDNGFTENTHTFVNNINTHEGGSHLTGLKAALTRTINDYAKKNKLLKKADDSLSGDDVREGLTCVLSVRVMEPQFEGQTKTKLGNSEVRGAVETAVNEYLAIWLDENPKAARAVIEKSLQAARAREAARKARDLARKKNALEGGVLPGKLADCSLSDPTLTEIFIVEGDSAGGCFSGDTQVALADGRHLSFVELIEEDRAGKRNFCYTVRKDGGIGLEEIRHPRRTKTNTEVLKVILDNGEEITCTPDHRFMLRDGSYRKAADLAPGQSLMPLYRKDSDRDEPGITIDGYEMVFCPRSETWLFTHVLADWYNRWKNVGSDGALDLEAFRESRVAARDRTVLRFDTFCDRYYDGDVDRAVDAVRHHNHKVVRVERMETTMDVYDLEVPGTHNFALASGVFVHNSAKQGRDRSFQAILPIKGKILNVERARIDKILSNDEVRAMITAIGAGIRDDFDIKSARYGKIIIMTDADVDGAHIRTLLLTFFFRQMRELIEAGSIYIAQPPLYRVGKGKEEYYAYSEDQRTEIVKRITNGKGDEARGLNIQRYKGLGEMNPDQLWNTTMDPQSRTILQVTMESAAGADSIFSRLMGDDVEPRREFIEKNARYVKNLDI